MATRWATISTVSAFALKGIGPAGDLVQVRPDPRQLAGALALRLAGANLHPNVASSATHVPLPLGGAQPPAKPLPGTRGAWPQRVGWLSHRNWPPAVASITPGIPGREGGASSRMSVVGRGPPVVYTAEIPYSETRTLRSA